MKLFPLAPLHIESFAKIVLWVTFIKTEEIDASVVVARATEPLSVFRKKCWTASQLSEERSLCGESASEILATLTSLRELVEPHVVGRRIPHFQPLRHKSEDLEPKGAEQSGTTGTPRPRSRTPGPLRCAEPVPPTRRTSNTVASIEDNFHHGNMEQQTAVLQGGAQQLVSMMAQMIAQVRDQSQQMVAQMQSQNQQIMAQLREQMGNHQKEHANEREDSQAQIQALQGELAALRATPTGTTPQAQVTPGSTPQAPTPTPPVAPAKKKPTLPDPPRFDGVRRKFRASKQEMESKLETDGSTIGSERDQFAYIFARLGDSSQAMVSAFYSLHRELGTGTTKEFL
ncbi:hypothetical protein N658DRAFT_489480 [Parathielavia hyrcaniae]|uniref:Uncharacterized protein n=1 Tax=Parathielavia hyrcaniae TaxID=113614 RepID=A0AAN6PSG2_9PEZI|nr:hypothetical protein N658DRAFT_489480 [Parathielavia hyrcaniae]